MTQHSLIALMVGESAPLLFAGPSALLACACSATAIAFVSVPGQQVQLSKLNRATQRPTQSCALLRRCTRQTVLERGMHQAQQQGLQRSSPSPQASVRWHVVVSCVFSSEMTRSTPSSGGTPSTARCCSARL